MVLQGDSRSKGERRAEKERESFGETTRETERERERERGREREGEGQTLSNRKQAATFFFLSFFPSVFLS